MGMSSSSFSLLFYARHSTDSVTHTLHLKAFFEDTGKTKQANRRGVIPIQKMII